jgi:hypothetical protein
LYGKEAGHVSRTWGSATGLGAMGRPNEQYHFIFIKKIKRLELI